MVFWTLFGGLAASVLSGAVLGAALGLTGFAILWFHAEGALQIGVQAVWNMLTTYTLTAVPLFILLGDVLVASGLAAGVYRALAPVFARVPGGLLHTNIAVCTIFGAVSGSSMSVAAAVGSVAYPELKRRGYDRPAVVGSLAGGGTLGLLIPPSLSLLIYGALTDTSIGKLFVAGVVPGLMMACLFSAYIAWAARRNPAMAPERGEAMPLGAILRGTLQVWPLAVMIVAVLGSLFAGIATPTEAAAVGVAAVIVLGFTMGELTPAKLAGALMSTTRTFAVVGVVFLGAVVLAQAISLLGLPQQMLEFVVSMGLSKYAALLIVVVIYLVLGCFFDGLSMMIMTLPIVFPLLTGLGFDPIWLGVVITVMIEVGMLTPPVGMVLFVLAKVSRLGFEETVKAVLPWMVPLFATLIIITFFPSVVLWLPKLLYP